MDDDKPGYLEEHIPDVVIEHFLREYGDSDPVHQAAYSNPLLFAEFFRDGERWGICKKDLAQWAGTAWHGPGDRYLGRWAWREMFDLVGYRENDEPAQRPTEPLGLWRGATPEHRDNWSWTKNRDVAVLYASGHFVQGVRRSVARGRGA